MSRDFLDVPGADRLGVTHGYSRLAPARGTLPDAVELRDVTLREGNQCAEIALSTADKVELARLLDEAGVGLIQVGFAGDTEHALEKIAAVRQRAHLSVVWLTFVDGWQANGRRAVEAGADELIVTQRIGEGQLKALDMSEDDVIARLAEAAAVGRELGVRRLALQPAYATGARPEFWERLLEESAGMGFDTVDVVDSIGVASTEVVEYMVGTACRTSQCVVGTHMHNDLGLATANAIAGVMAGARMADVSVLGFGERAGNTPLEQLSVALPHLYGVSTGVDTTRLVELCTLASRLTGQVPGPNHPVTGRDAFAQKVEVHVRSFLKDFALHEPYPPELVGHRRQIKLGLGTGVTGIAAKARELDLDVPAHRHDRLARLVNEWSLLNKRSVPDHLFVEFVRIEG